MQFSRFVQKSQTYHCLFNFVFGLSRRVALFDFYIVLPRQCDDIYARRNTRRAAYPSTNVYASSKYGTVLASSTTAVVQVQRQGCNIYKHVQLNGLYPQYGTTRITRARSLAGFRGALVSYSIRFFIQTTSGVLQYYMQKSQSSRRVLKNICSNQVQLNMYLIWNDDSYT